MDKRFFIKVLISALIIAACTLIGRKQPTLAGLIAVMPLTGLLVMVWLYRDKPGDSETMIKYAKGAVWGILPSILFFATALLCFYKRLPLWAVLCASFAVWLAGAFIHQLLLK
jgi:uncharacterized membrane protein (GlpM family)